MNRLQTLLALCLITITVAGYYVYVRGTFAQATNCPRISRIANPSRNHKNGKTILDYFYAMRLIPSGNFQMGDVNGEGDERPVYKASVSEFYMGATPVTVAMWREYTLAMNLPMPEPPEWGWIEGHPMVNVSWDDIMGPDGRGGYCAWASGVTGVRLTLPTESQLEYVARNGTDEKYPWGREFDDSKVWASVKWKRSQPAPVIRSYSIHLNRYGVTDMIGNVSQWCLNEYSAYSVKGHRPEYGTDYIDSETYSIRGGTYLDESAKQLRVTNRMKRMSYRWHPYLGFRLSTGPF